MEIYKMINMEESKSNVSINKKLMSSIKGLKEVRRSSKIMCLITFKGKIKYTKFA